VVSDAEWEAHQAFYRLTVAQRDAAWHKVEQLKAENARLTAALVAANKVCHFAQELMRIGYDDGPEEEALTAALTEWWRLTQTGGET